MVKTVILNDQVHQLIINKQKELKDKYRVDVKIGDIVNIIILDNIQRYDIVDDNIENKIKGSEKK